MLGRGIRLSRPAGGLVLSAAARRGRGVFYTPPELVELVLSLTLPAEWEQRGSGAGRRILDPACGAGEFLAGAAAWLGERRMGATLCGVDVDAAAVRVARERLSSCAERPELVVGDALDRELLQAESFDAIVGNPPYVSIRELAKSIGAKAVAALREQYLSARGNFDLYAVFIERAIELLKPGGWCGLVVPNKWATLDYARGCRELLLARTSIEHVVDLAGCKAFSQANVYPHVLVFRKGKTHREQRVLFSMYEPAAEDCDRFGASEERQRDFAALGHREQVLATDQHGFSQPGSAGTNEGEATDETRPGSAGTEEGEATDETRMKHGCFEQKEAKVTKGMGEDSDLRGRRRLSAFVVRMGVRTAAAVSQGQLRVEGFCFGEELDVEARAGTLPLGEVATIACGTAGYAAREVAGWLVDSSPALPRSNAACVQFVTTRNIERYLIRQRPLRYLGRQCQYPWLPADCRELTAAKRELIRRPKIVVAGMSRRLEAALDMGGRALGVQVFAVYQPRVDLHYLLGLVNSKLWSYLFATRFLGKRLGGGYLAINKGQLARLPVRMVGEGERSDLARQQRISELARLAGPGCLAVDAEIDRLVFELYRVGAGEIERVEGAFEGRSVAA